MDGYLGQVDEGGGWVVGSGGWGGWCMSGLDDGGLGWMMEA